MAKIPFTKAELLGKIEADEHTIKALKELVEVQTQQLKAQAEQLEAQAQRLAELEKRLSLNSETSSKAPSSDGLRKPPRTQSLRVPGKKRSGGQVGHPGQTLRQVTAPDCVIEHSISNCIHCAQSLINEPVVGVVKRQVFDLRSPKMEVIEHQAPIKVCPHCRVRERASFPEGVDAPVQYGDRIQSLAVYLQHQHFIPEDRLQQLFADWCDLSISTASLAQFSQAAAEQLVGFAQAVHTQLQQAPVKHLDETGLRIEGKTQWAHVISNAQLTHYVMKPKRACEWKDLIGTVAHDHWTSYYTLLSEVQHALCNQHHLRELQALVQYEKESWARQMQRGLRYLLRYRHAHGEQAIPPDKLKRIKRCYEAIIAKGLAYHQTLTPYTRTHKKGRIAHRPGHNLLIRLQTRQADVLRFLIDSAVPFTNNQAEQDLRMIKCKQKISGGFRSYAGAHIFARIRGFISTARKQGWNIIDSIRLVCQNRGSLLIPQLVSA